MADLPPEDEVKPSGRYTAKLAHVKIRLNSAGYGRTIINGVDVSGYTRAVTIISEVGEITKVVLEVLAEQIDVEQDEVAIFLRELRLIEKPLEHDWDDPIAARPICKVCRIVKGLPATPEFCSGPPSWAKKAPLKTS